MGIVRRGAYQHRLGGGELYHWSMPHCCEKFIRKNQRNEEDDRCIECGANYQYCPRCGTLLTNKVIYDKDIKY